MPDLWVPERDREIRQKPGAREAAHRPHLCDRGAWNPLQRPKVAIEPFLLLVIFVGQGRLRASRHRPPRHLVRRLETLRKDAAKRADSGCPRAIFLRVCPRLRASRRFSSCREEGDRKQTRRTFLFRAAVDATRAAL